MEYLQGYFQYTSEFSSQTLPMITIDLDAVALLILCSILFISSMKSERGLMISMLLSLPFILYLFSFTNNVQSCLVLVFYAFSLGVRKLYLLPGEWYREKYIEIFSINLWCAFHVYLFAIFIYLLFDKEWKGMYYMSKRNV